jgi:hypothetical protein
MAAAGHSAARRASSRWPGARTEPTRRAASTHILKVGSHAFAHSDVAEFVTVRAAALLGTRVAHTEITRFGQQSAMVSDGTTHHRNGNAERSSDRLDGLPVSGRR